MVALGSSFISCTAPDKTFGVRLPDTLIAESPWVVTPGAYLGKLFLVLISNSKSLDMLFLISKAKFE